MLLRILILSLVFCSTLYSQENIDGWKINDGHLVDSSSITVRNYWHKINEILPQDLIIKYVSRLSLTSDGIAEDLGGMIPLDESNARWAIDLDTMDMDLSNQDSAFTLNYLHTLIHEFGHLLTLNAEQVYTTDDEFQGASDNYLTVEGYAYDSSYLNSFVNRFWDIELLNEWDKIDKIKNETRRINLLFEFYLQQSQKFVTDYAAESPEEDIAESWTYFVLSAKPIRNEVKYQKVLFFYDFPELIAYKNQIRRSLPIIPKNYLENFKVNYDD